LYAVKKYVYDEKRFTLCELRDILAKNWEGYGETRSEIARDPEKYGNNIDVIDSLAVDIMEKTARHGYAKRTPLGERYAMDCEGINHGITYGKKCAATPDGRLAGFPLGDGSGPCQGRELKGPTASILSSTKWEHSPLIGGVAVNMKFSKSNLGEHSVEVMKSLVRTYIERGGFEMQINVTDRRILEAARENPELYSDLVVRIGGYSDYFTRLSPEMQAEVILRTEHSI
jgi:formate C-acetyltransferase